MDGVWQVAAARLYSYKALEPGSALDGNHARSNDARSKISNAVRHSTPRTHTQFSTLSHISLFPLHLLCMCNLLFWSRFFLKRGAFARVFFGGIGWVVQVVLPSYASWFSMDHVDDIEQAALPDLTSSPQACLHYVALRNGIVLLYRDIAGRRLEAIDCLRHLAHTTPDVLRVHAFLDFWGIINTDAEGRIRFQKTQLLLQEPPPRNAGGASEDNAGVGNKDKPKVASTRGYGKCAVTGQVLQRLCYASKTHAHVMLSPTAYSHVSPPPLPLPPSLPLACFVPVFHTRCLS